MTIMTNTILVTGATGNIGSGLVPNLLAQGETVRALVRDPLKAAGLAEAGVELVRGDLDRPETLDAAFKGVDKVFLLTAPNPNQVTQAHNGIVAARRAGVSHLVRLSAGAIPVAVDAAARVTRQHAAIDAEITASGLAYTILRPHFFVQNLLIATRSIAADAALYLPAKNAELGMIDVRDVVEAATAVLTEDGHEGQIYVLTGPRSISFHDVAHALTTALGTEVQYVDVPAEAAREAMIDLGVSEWVSDALNEYFQLFSEGLGDFTTPAVEALTGHAARSIDTFARDFAAAIKPAAQPA